MLVALVATFLQPMPFPPREIVIRGGTIYDGTGRPGYHADVRIVGDRIVKIGKVTVRAGDQVIAPDLSMPIATPMGASWKTPMPRRRSGRGSRPQWSAKMAARICL